MIGACQIRSRSLRSSHGLGFGEADDPYVRADAHSPAVTIHQERLPLREALATALGESPQPLAFFYDVVRRLRPETAKETIRARIYEGVARGDFARVAPGIYYSCRGEGQLLVVEGDAWDVLSKLDQDSIDALVTDPPGKFGRDWAGQGTTRPHSKLGGRTYQQPELDREFLRQAFRVLKKERAWNTLSRERRARQDFPLGGAACVLRVPLENRTTRPHVQELIRLAEEVGFVFYGEIVIALDRIGMGYDGGRDLGSKWLLFHAGPRNGVLWDLSLPNVIPARRISNAAKEGATHHEAEKDPREVLPILRAVLRRGEVVLDCFAGAATWVQEALAEGFHAILVEKQPPWAEAIARGRRELGQAP